MVRKRYTEEQIIAVLNEAKAGARTADLCRKHGMSDATFYNWKAKYAGLTVSELKRLKSLEDENRRLMKIPSHQASSTQFNLLGISTLNCIPFSLTVYTAKCRPAHI